MCHIQRFADDRTTVGGPGEELFDWSHRNLLPLQASKTKELVNDSRRDHPTPRPPIVGTEEVKVVETCKYLDCGWTTSWTGRTTQSSEQDGLPEETETLQHLQEAPMEISLWSPERRTLDIKNSVSCSLHRGA